MATSLNDLAIRSVREKIMLYWKTAKDAGKAFLDGYTPINSM